MSDHDKQPTTKQTPPRGRAAMSIARRQKAIDRMGVSVARWVAEHPSPIQIAERELAAARRAILEAIIQVTERVNCDSEARDAIIVPLLQGFGLTEKELFVGDDKRSPRLLADGARKLCKLAPDKELASAAIRAVTGSERGGVFR